MTIPDGYVISVRGHFFFLIEMLRPKEDVPGDYLNGKVWYWKLVARDGTEVSYGYVKHRRNCKGGARRAASRWLLSNDRRRIIGDKLELDKQQIQAIEDEVKTLLHASRDAMRNRGEDTTRLAFRANEGFYGEAFGVLRCLATLGFGTLTHAVNTPETRENLKWWFGELMREVLEEENFRGSGCCEHCRKRYGKDDELVGTRETECPVCRGNGKINIAGITDTCGHCHGVGKVSKETAERLGSR